MVARRAIEAVNWGMPAVNFDLMLQAMIGAAEGRPNQIVYWSRLPDWKIQTLTAEPDVIYLMPFFNTTDAGPMVLEIPAADGGSITGTIMDAWQAALEDVGPAGAERGAGGKYLLLPPDHRGVVPSGYIGLPSTGSYAVTVTRSQHSNGTYCLTLTDNGQYGALHSGLASLVISGHKYTYGTFQVFNHTLVATIEAQGYGQRGLGVHRSRHPRQHRRWRFRRRLRW